MSEKSKTFYVHNEPLSTDHAIILPHIDDCSYSRYLEEINSAIGSKHIHSIYESNGQIKIYFKDKKCVNKILESGIFLNKDYSKVSPQDYVLLKITLSRVHPAIPDNCIEEVLKTYGHLESPIVHTKVSEKSDFNHIDCGIREVELKVYNGLKLPTKINLFYNGIFYEVNAKVNEQTPLKRTSDMKKTKKKGNYGKCKSTNILKYDSSLDYESFPEWWENNPDNGGGTKSQNSVDLLLQVHQSKTCLPKKNYQFYDKENNTAVLYGKKIKLPVIQEQQFVAFSKNCVANISFDVTTKMDEVLKKLHPKSNGVILHNRTSSQTLQTWSDKTHMNLNRDKTKRLDSTKKRHTKFKIIPEEVASGNVRNKPVKTALNLKKVLPTKVHNTRGILKKKFSHKSNICHKIIDPPNHSIQKNKSRIEKSDFEHNEIYLPSTSSFSPNFSGNEKILSEKMSVCDIDISPPPKSSKLRSAKEKISEKASVPNKNIYPLSNSSLLLNHKTVKRKTTLKNPCTYNDLVCSNSSLPKHKTAKKKNLGISNNFNKEYSPSNTLSFPKQKFGKGIILEESENVSNNICLPSSTSSKCRAVKGKASKEYGVNSGEDMSLNLGDVKIVSSEESSVCNNNVCLPSNSPALPKSRAVKRKNAAEEYDADNCSSPKSLSSANIAVQKRKKHKEKAIICDNDAHLSSKSTSLSNNTAAQSIVQSSSFKDCNQNVIEIHQPGNLSAIPIDNSLSESDYSDSPILGPISNATSTSLPNIENQHSTTATCNDENQHSTTTTCNDVSSNSNQAEVDTKNIEVNFNVCDKDTESTKPEINNEELSNKHVPCDLNAKTLCLSSSAVQTNVQISTFGSTNLNVDNYSLLKILNPVSDGDLQEKVSSDVKECTQNLICDVINLNSSETEKNEDLTKNLVDEVMHISSSEEKKETLQKISLSFDHISPSLVESSTVETHSNKKDLDFSLCNPEELDSSKSQSQNTVPLDISQPLCEDNQSSHLSADVILSKTASDMPFSKNNCEEPAIELGFNKDKNNKNDITISNDEIKNSNSANQERTSLHNLPNIIYNESNSNEINSQQYNKQQVVPRKYVKSKFRSSLTVNPAPFLIKNRVKNKSKNNGRYPANKMVHRLQYKNSLNHQTKKLKEYRNRPYLFSSTQDKNIYEYEFDSDEDYADQVSYSKWKNQNCSSKEYKKLDTNFTKRLTHSFGSYLQNKKRRDRINDVIMDENSEVNPLNNKIGSISELRKRFKEAISPTSTKLASTNKKFDDYYVQTAGESSTKRKRVDSSQNFHSDNDYFEVVHVGDGKHEKLSIIVKKKSKLDAPNKRDSVNVNSDLQALERISKNSPSEKSRKRISNDLMQNTSSVLNSEISNLSSHNISCKTVPKYRVKSNTSSDGKIISTPKTPQVDVSITHCNHQDSLVPENNTLNKKGIIGKSQQFLQSNTNKLANGHSSYKIVLQKISDYSSKKSSSQVCRKKIIKTKYRLKSNHEEAISKTGKGKLVSKSKYSIDKNSSTNSDVFSGNRNDLRTNDQTEFVPINKENKIVPITNVITDSVPPVVLQKNDNCGEVDFRSCVSGFLQQLATSSGQKKIPVQDYHKNPEKNSQKLLLNTCSQISKLNLSNELQNNASLEKDLLECNQEQNVDAIQEKNDHLIPKVTNGFLDKISHSDLHSTSHYEKDNDDASDKVLAGDDLNCSYPLKECSVFLERISLPDKLVYKANPSTFLESEDNNSKPLNAEENEQNRLSSSTVVYIKQEPCYPPTFDGVESIIEIEESCSSSLSVPNFSHDLESTNYVPCQDAILSQANENVVIRNATSYSETGEDFSKKIYEVKEEPQLKDCERKITNYLSAASSCILKQTEVLNGNQKLPQCVNDNSSLSIDKMKSPSTYQAANPLLCNGSNPSVSTKSAGKLKKGNTKLTSIDKIAEFCALRKSASQIPAHQLKISLLEKQDSPVINSEISSEQIHLGSLPSFTIETIVDGCVKPGLNEKSTTENNKGNGSVELLKHKSALCGEINVLSSETGSNNDVNFPSIDSSIRKDQNRQAAVTLEQTRNTGRKESTFTSCVEGPGISNVEKELIIKPSNPAEVEVQVDKLAPAQLNQSGCERNNSPVVLNRTDTYVVKSVAVKPQYIVNKNISNPEKRIYPKLNNKFPLSEKKLIAFINCMKYTKNVRHTTLQMLARNKTPGALKDLIVQLYDFFQACNDDKIKLQISRVIMLLNEK